MLDNVRQKVYDTLEAAGIPYQVWEHPAVFTIEEMDALHLPRPEIIAKNLFLRCLNLHCQDLFFFSPVQRKNAVSCQL